MAQSVDVVAAAHDLPIGAKIQAEALRLMRWPRDSIPPGAFTDPQAVVGAFTKAEFFANEPIVANKLYMGDRVGGVMPLLIPPGMRAMSVPVDEVADIAGFVQPHTRVDVLAAMSGGGNDTPPFSRIVVQNVEVLAVAQEIARPKDDPTVVKVVTLLVTPEDAEKLALASREGTLRLAMRAFTDNKLVAAAGFDLRDLMKIGGGGAPAMPVMQSQPLPVHRTAAAAPKGPPPVTVQVLRDGKESEAISFVHNALVVHESERKPMLPRLPEAPAPPAAAQPSASSSATTPGPSAPDATGAFAASPGAAPMSKTIPIP
jgi:pilus assembly protein CpaB